MDVFVTSLKASVQATSNTLVICVLGALLSRTGLFAADARKKVNPLLSDILLPALLFSRVVPIITVDKFVLWWMLPVSCFFVILLGCFMGYLFGKVVLRHNFRRSRFVAVCVGFSNGTSVPLGLALPIIAFAPQHFASDTSAEAVRRAQDDVSSYILFYSLFSNVLRWSLALWLMKSGLEPQTETVALTEVEIADGDNDNNNDSRDKSTSPVAVAAPKSSLIIQRMKQVLGFISPPVRASIIALIIGLAPPLQGLFYGQYYGLSRPPLAALGDAVYTVGSAYVPFVLMQLGGNIHDEIVKQRKERTEGKQTPWTRRMISEHVGIHVLKLVVMPLVLFPLMRWCHAAGLMSPAPTFQLILLLQTATPTSINLSVIAARLNVYVRDIAMVLAVSYLLSIITLTAWTTLFISIAASPD